MTHVTGNAPEGTPDWLDLGVPDLDRAKAFYGPLFGWEFQDMGADAGNYNLCLLRGEPIAGMMLNPEDQPPVYWWNVYFAADDCDKVVQRVVDAGGEVVAPPMDVMDLGRMAIVKDSANGQFGLWQGDTHVGSAIVNEPGSFTWNDLFVPGDAGPAREFYGKVFGHRADPIPGGMDYTTLARPDGRVIGGVFGGEGVTLGGEAVPLDDFDEPAASWITYFAVEDADEAVRQVRAGGGTVDEEPTDTPYGRIATVRDPFGIPFRVMKVADDPQE